MSYTDVEVLKAQKILRRSLRKQICTYCGGEFFATRNAFYCSGNCNQKSYLARHSNGVPVVVAPAPVPVVVAPAPVPEFDNSGAINQLIFSKFKNRKK